MTDLPEMARAPWRAAPARVLPEWIDYNGHMNVAWYTMAFDLGLDEMLDQFGIGPDAARLRRFGPYALQSQFHYLGELLEGQSYRCAFQILDHDAKRIHIWGEMENLETGTPAATIETLLVCVDLTARKSMPFPPDVATRIDVVATAHASLPRPERAGAAIAIRR